MRNDGERVVACQVTPFLVDAGSENRAGTRETAFYLAPSTDTRALLIAG